MSQILLAGDNLRDPLGKEDRQNNIIFINIDRIVSSRSLFGKALETEIM
jgi:hypothetical protein